MNYELMFALATNIATAKREGTSPEITYNIGGKNEKLTFVQQQKLLSKQVQAFMHRPATGNSVENSIQAFAGSSDLPRLTKDVFTVNQYTTDWDLEWQKAFRGIKLGQGQLDWEIATVESGIAFKLIPEGGKVQYGDIAGEKVTATIEKYGAGLGVTWETIHARKLYKFVQIMEDARAALYTLWADIHYGLIAAAGTSNQVAYQGASTDRQIDRDIQTISKGADDCGEANKDKGYGNMASARFLLYVSPKLRSRMGAALSATSAEMKIAQGKGQTVTSNVTPLFTYNPAVPTNKGLLVLPGNKIQNSVYLNEMGFSRQEIESLNELKTYWTAFGAIIADTDQVYELAFA